MSESEIFLMSKFTELSPREKLEALNDLHYAESELDENPLKVHQMLTEFEDVLERVHDPIYEQALKQDSSYVEDPAFRLKFLRANGHSVPKAVKQMIEFLKNKARYFGTDKLTSDITFDDMTPEELKIILSGIYHVQGGLDRSGRVILHRFNRLLPNNVNEETMIRVNYYIWFNILIPIHSVQKKGILGICYDTIMKEDETHTNNLDLDSTLQISKFMCCLPFRYSGFHFCLKQKERLHNMLLGFGVSIIPEHARERSKVHCGSDEELQHQLSSDGIPLDTLPVDIHGNLRESTLSVWLHGYLEKASDDVFPSEEENNDDDDDSSFMSSSSSSFEEERDNSHANGAASNRVQDDFGPTDVLLGRGKKAQYHPGNLYFRDFLDQKRLEYEVLPRHQKKQACITFIRELLSDGIRFLTERNRSWVVADFNEVVGKVAQFFRTRRRALLR